MSSPLLDDGPLPQVQDEPPVVDVEVLDDDEEVLLLRLLVDVEVVEVVEVVLDRVLLVVLDEDEVVERDEVAVELELLRLGVELAVVDVEALVVVLLVLLVLPAPPPTAEAETTVAPGDVPLVAAQKPNDVDCPAATVPFHASGVTVSVFPAAANDPLHDWLNVPPPSDKTTVHDVIAADPLLATTTLSQYPAFQLDVSLAVTVKAPDVSADSTIAAPSSCCDPHAADRAPSVPAIASHRLFRIVPFSGCEWHRSEWTRDSRRRGSRNRTTCDGGAILRGDATPAKHDVAIFLRSRRRDYRAIAPNRPAW